MLISLLDEPPIDNPAAAWGWIVGLTVSAALVAFISLWIMRAVARRGNWAPQGFDVMRRLAPPVCLLATVLINRIALPKWGLLKDEQLVALDIASIVCGAWTAIGLVSGVRHWLCARFDINTADNLRARSVQTQLGFIEKIVDLALVLSAISAALYQLSWGRTLGTSLLASAGVASLIIGFAAQRTLSNLIAGFQIAFTQPMRLGDAVVVEDEWGWVEEITLTYVVIRVWDLRRLVLPITYFIEKPFQNWTRNSAQILGSVQLTVSHDAPFDAIEQHFFKVLDADERWDQDARVLQVIESNERSVVLRALMTSKDSPTCWDLRCEVRRRLLEFLAREHPEALPNVRLKTTGRTNAEVLA